MTPTFTLPPPSPLVGCWQLLSIAMQHADGRTSEPFGAQPQGWAIYSASGHMSITIQRTPRPPLAHAQLYAASASEKASIADSFSAYAGRYDVHAAQSIVQHHIEVSSFPNWNATTQLRRYQLEGDTLTLSTLNPAEATTTLIWRRQP